MEQATENHALHLSTYGGTEAIANTAQHPSTIEIVHKNKPQ